MVTLGDRTTQNKVGMRSRKLACVEFHAIPGYRIYSRKTMTKIYTKSVYIKFYPSTVYI